MRVRVHLQAGAFGLNFVVEGLLERAAGADRNEALDDEALHSQIVKVVLPRGLV